LKCLEARGMEKRVDWWKGRKLWKNLKLGPAGNKLSLFLSFSLSILHYFY
jgi:hypothetical protein